MPLVVDTIVTNRQEFPEEGKVTYERTVVCAPDDIPFLIRKATGLTAITFKACVTEDYRNRAMTVVSENISLRKFLLLDEVTGE